MDTIGDTLSAADAETAVLCLLNPAAHSDGAAGMRDRLTQVFAQTGRRVRIEEPSGIDDLERSVRKAVDAGAKLVIAGGGDGTINVAANALAGSETALGVLPLGTLNHFAKDLGIPLELEAAVSNALGGRVRAVDVGEVNGRIFVNNSSIGLYPEIVREREALRREGESKWVALARAAIAVAGRSTVIPVRMSTPQQRVLKTKTEFVFVGNNEYQLAAPRIGARVRLDGGELWVMQVPHTGRFRAVGEAARAFVAAGKPHPPFAFTARELRIDTSRRSIDVAFDGEVMRMQTPLLYRSRPRALRVVVPHTA
ncbi:MAG TPA: diacylglycerol kinase family protein [Rhizomicrobium sp.]|jgi:diacylglycerol kinase family enzyme|nr:diacylglycerol kinase family protein [Rhizomicrobium sp.]